MPGKGFCVTVRFDLHAITCPGVWLCPNGKIALRIRAFNTNALSQKIFPAFPLLFHDSFTFRKTFREVGSLAELQKILGDEWLHAKLVQWSVAHRKPIILATFESSLVDLLYPTSCLKGLLSGADIDLLMESTKWFPGIISPKIEVSTKTTVEEIPILYDSMSSSKMRINNESSDCIHKKKPANGIIRQRRVCHSRDKPSEDESNLLERMDEYSLCTSRKCYHAMKDKLNAAYKFSYEEGLPPKYGSYTHSENNCPVCCKYDCYVLQKCFDVPEKKTLCRKSTNHVKCTCSESSFAKIYSTSELSDTSQSHSPTNVSLLQSRVGNSRKAKNPSSPVRSYRKPDDFVKTDHSCGYVPNQCNHEFYKNLEKFYKKMYKRARNRVREESCS